MLKSDRWIRKMAKEHDMINLSREKQGTGGVNFLWAVFVWLRLTQVGRLNKIFTM